MVTSFFLHGRCSLSWTSVSTMDHRLSTDNKPISNTIFTSSRPFVIRSAKNAFLDDSLSHRSPRLSSIADLIVQLIYVKLIVTATHDKEPDSSAEEDEGVDESENQEEGSLGRHGGHTARNGLVSATLPVRVTSRLSVTRTSSPITATTITITTTIAVHNLLTAATILYTRGLVAELILAFSRTLLRHRFHILSQFLPYLNQKVVREKLCRRSRSILCRIEVFCNAIQYLKKLFNFAERRRLLYYSLKLT